MVGDHHAQLEGLVIRLSNGRLNIDQDPSDIYTSFNSRYLDSYAQGVMKADLFDLAALAGIGTEYSQNYQRFLGFRNIHLGSLVQAGFLNPHYDMSFCFRIENILSLPHLVCDPDVLMEMLFHGTDPKVKEIFKEKGKYSLGDEVLVRELDLKKATRVLTYTEDAGNKLETHPLLKGITRTDLSEIRKAAIESYFK
jgi:hypothetical protein